MPPLPIENRVAAQLQNIVILVGPSRHPAAQQGSAEAQQHAGVDNVKPRRAAEPEGVIRRERRVAECGKGKGMAAQDGRHPFRLAEADREHLAPKRADLRIDLFHLAEVFSTGDSGKVAEEDEEQSGRVEVGQPRRRAIGTLQRTIGRNIADLEHAITGEMHEDVENGILRANPRTRRRA